ncbi:MAG: diphosphomevalonate decarboxylase [Flavobacteriales bacterium]|nr:diphosphomevalonate decarboxylase [Flavobacteriales bacterium]
MKSFSFTIPPKESSVNSGKIDVECPSNIALVKYWGKYENQIPANSSISYTLTNCKTKTFFTFQKSTEFNVAVTLDGVQKEEFATKIKKYFSSIEQYLPFIKEYSYEIITENSFPHSSGIASSASGFGAIAKALIKMRDQLFPEKEFSQKEIETSFLARLGSGSASRSIYNGLVVWGNNDGIDGSSDEYAIPFPYQVHENFRNYHDTILLIHEGQKTVSSTVGHGLMNNHPYASLRFNQANENLKKLIPILESGDFKGFIALVESEALTLHAMMMMSSPYFILMKPNTLACIEKIWNFRKLTNSNVCFTLDAGANLHILYPKSEFEHVQSFIKNDLLKYTENGNYINDSICF